MLYACVSMQRIRQIFGVPVVRFGLDRRGGECRADWRADAIRVCRSAQGRSQTQDGGHSRCRSCDQFNASGGLPTCVRFGPHADQVEYPATHQLTSRLAPQNPTTDLPNFHHADPLVCSPDRCQTNCRITIVNLTLSMTAIDERNSFRLV